MLRVLLIAIANFCVSIVYAQPLRIAVAANAQFVMKVLEADFRKKTGIQAELIIGSSGNLSTQIKNGAPYDLFLSADMHFPDLLFKEKFATTTPRPYALGSLIVCTTTQSDIRNWPQQLLAPDIRKIALADPALAPYGKAAQQALQHYGILDKLSSKLVTGQSISQVNTYITSGVAEIGFTTESLVYEYREKNKLKWVRIDPAVYEQIRQGIVLLRYAKTRNYERALKFYNYIFSPAAKQIFKSYGYRVL